MIVSESAVALIFRVVNTIVVAIVALYAFKKYALVRIKDLMGKKEQELIDLRLQATKLGLEVKKFALQIKKEEESTLRMQEHILQWRIAVDEARTRRRKQQDSLRETAIERQKIKNAYIRSTALYNQAVPRALETAQVGLKQHFASAHAARAYIQDIIAFVHASER